MIQCPCDVLEKEKNEQDEQKSASCECIVYLVGFSRHSLTSLFLVKYSTLESQDGRNCVEHRYPTKY